MLIEVNGGRRNGVDRRRIIVQIDFSDRRSGNERRSGFDRRSGFERRSPEGFRAIFGMDRRGSCFKT
jgi:hypothetical protein